MSIAARVRGRWPMSTMVDRVLRGRSRTRIVETPADAGECDETLRRPRCRPRRVRASATAYAVVAIAAAVGLGATPASASSGCDAVNNGSLSHTSTVSDSTFQVVTRAVNLGLTTERFTSGDAIHYSYTISNPNGGVHAYYRPTNAAGGAVSSVAFIGTSTNTSTTGDVTTSGSGSVTLPANITDIYLYDTQLNAGTSATISWMVSCTPAGGAASPAVTAISPTGGPAGGGTSVTLTGTGFTGATAVKFGAVAAAGFTVNSATSITATAPAAAAAGVVNVAVTTGAGTSLAASGNQFTYAAPTVTGISPAALVAAATGSITITGTNFVPGNTSVAVGGTAATGVSCSSATSCTATAPARTAGTYDVVVTTGGVASATSAADRLVYVAPPTVTAAFSPGTITTAQTTTLTVTLTNDNAGTALTGVALAASTLPAGLSGSGSGTTCSGTLSATSTAFAVSGASLAAGASCTVTLTVTPTAGAAAYPLTTGAVSASGPTTLTGTTASATLTVSAPALATTQSTPSVTGTVGTALSAVTPVTASGGTSPYGFALSGGTLPSGLAFDTATGQLTGTPGSALAATTFTVTVTDATSPSAQTSGKTFQLTIAQGTQTISFAALSNASLSASPLTLSATASSGLTVAFASATTGVCTVTGNSVTLLTVGTCTIKADQPGNVNIAAAPQVQRSFTVTPANLAVTAGAVSGASVGGSYSQANPASGGTAPYSYTLASGALPPGTTLGASTGTVTGVPTSVGGFSYAIQATDSQGVPASATGATVSGTIAQGTQTISFAALSNASLSASPLTLAATASSSLGVTFASATTGVCTVAGNSVTLLTVGTCTIKADQPGNVNIAAAPQVQRSFTVTPANLSVTPGAVSGASVGGSYSQANPASGGTAPYSYTLASGALPPGTTLSSSTGTVTGVPTSAGGFSYVIQATDSQGVPASATGATVSGTIAQGTQTISFAALSNASLSASPLTLAATASSSLGVTFASATTGVCTVAGNSVTLLTVGTCTINADQPGNANIAAAPQVQRSFTVTPANLAVTAGAVSGASVGGSYSQANPASGGTAPYSYTLASGALPPGTTLGASTGMVTGVPTSAGGFSYAIQATDSQGVPASATGGTVTGTIAQGTQTISFAALSNASLSSSPLTLSATASSSLGVTFASATTGVCTVAGNGVTLLTVGTCTINADQPGNANIAAAPQVQRSFTVTVGAPVIADRNGVAIGYDSTGTPIDLAPSVSGTFSGLSIASAPTHGTATLSGTVVTYAPTPGYFGPDSFTLTATGPGGTSPTATVRMTVETPAAPIATPVSQTVPVTTTANPQGVEINLSDHVTGLFTTLEISQAPQNGTVLLTASVASSAPPADPAAATLKAVATPIIAVYTPRAGFVGADSFQFVAVGPGGRSAPGTVSLTVVGNRPGARAKQAAVGDGQPVVVDLTADATEGPFTGATLVSVSPAGSAATALIEAGPVGNRTYRLSITPNARFGGTIAIAYTLTNAFGTSDPAIVTVTVTARPDPSADPTVRAISDAQAETTRRFAQTQIGNFMRRNEQLHTPSSGRGDPLGFRFNSRDGRRGAFDTRSDDNNLDVLDRFTGGDARSNGAIDRLPALGEREGGIGGPGRTGIADGVYRPGADGGRSNAAAASSPAGDRPDGRSVGGLALWTGGAIEIGTRDATTRRDKITASTQGLSGGVDLRIGDAATVGIGGGYGADLSEINGTAGRVRSDTGAIAAYGSANPIRGVFVDGVFGYGGLDFSTRRLVGNALATGKRDGSMWFGAVSAGIDRDTEALLWSVYGTVQWLDATLGRYVESGAGRLDLRFEARQVNSLSSVLGGRIGIVRDLPFGSVAPQIRGEWQHEFNGSSVQRFDYADIPEPSQYGLSTIGWRRDVFTLSFGSRWVLPGDWGLDLDLGLRGAAGQTSGQLRGQVSKKF